MMSKLKNFFNQTIDGVQFNGLLKGTKERIGIVGDWCDSTKQHYVDLTAFDNYYKLTHGNRNVYDDFEIGDASFYVQLSDYLSSRKYELDGLFNTMFYDYNPIENYDRTETTTTATITDLDERKTTNDYGELKTTNDYGERVQTSDYGQTQDTSVIGAITNSTQYGATTETTNLGTHTDSVQHGNHTDITSNSDTAFNSQTGYNAPTNQSSTNNAQYTDTTTIGASVNTVGTVQHTDTTSLGTHTDTVTGATHQDSITNDTYTDVSTVDTRQDVSTTDAVQDTTQTTVTSRIRGNIGITTSQQMGLAERQFVRFRFYDVLVATLNEFLLDFNYNY